MQVKTITYTKVLGAYVLGFKSMDKHMAEMMTEGWRVQSQNAHEGKTGFLSKKPDTMTVTYVKD